VPEAQRGTVLQSLIPMLAGGAGSVDIGAVLGQAVGGGDLHLYRRPDQEHDGRSTSALKRKIHVGLVAPK